MITLFRKGDNLFVKCEINLKRAVQYQEKIFKVGKHTELLLPEEVMCILTKNGNIKLWNGVKFIKMNLGQFNDVMSNNQFKVEVFVEDKPQKVEEPVKIVHPEPIVEEVKPVVQPQKVEEPVKVEVEEDVNKKKRHKQNQQGGDK